MFVRGACAHLISTGLVSLRVHTHQCMQFSFILLERFSPTKSKVYSFIRNSTIMTALPPPPTPTTVQINNIQQAEQRTRLIDVSRNGKGTNNPMFRGACAHLVFTCLVLLRGNTHYCMQFSLMIRHIAREVFTDIIEGDGSWETSEKVFPQLAS